MASTLRNRHRIDMRLSEGHVEVGKLGQCHVQASQPQKNNSCGVDGTRIMISSFEWLLGASWTSFILVGYLAWFEDVVKLILEKLPEKGRAIFMQTDVKVAKPFLLSRVDQGDQRWPSRAKGEGRRLLAVVGQSASGYAGGGQSVGRPSNLCYCPLSLKPSRHK